MDTTTLDTATTTTVPLDVIFVPDTGFKIGITVCFDDPTDGTPAPSQPVLFEFDTGGNGFWSGYSPNWWPKTTATTPTVSIHYSSGITYSAVAVSTTLYLPTGSKVEPEYLTASPVTVNQIYSATGKAWPDGGWQNAIDDKQPPLYDNFYGDFGAALNGTNDANSVLWQIKEPSGVGNGIVVSLPAFRKAKGPGVVDTGTLQIGLTTAEIAAAKNAATTMPLSKTEHGLSATGTLTIGGTAINANAVGILFDSGCPSTHLFTGTDLPLSALAPYITVPPDAKEPPEKGVLAPGFTLTLTSSNGVEIMTFSTGDESGKNAVSYSPDKGTTGRINTGLQPFFGNTILFYPDLPTRAAGFITITANKS